MKVKVVSGWGFRVLAVFLVLYGLIPLLHLTIPNEGIILAVLAVVAGVLILVIALWIIRRRRHPPPPPAQ